MDKNSPYYLFDRDSIGWLNYRHKNKQTVSNAVTKADVIRLLEANPDHASDRLLQEYVLKALKGELKGKRGRPGKSTTQGIRFLLAQDQYERCLVRLHARRKICGAKVHLEPSIRLADAVARKWRLRCSGRTFLSRISLTKKDGTLW